MAGSYPCGDLVSEDQLPVFGATPELHFALAEGFAEQVSGDLISRVLDAASRARPPGRPTSPPEEIPGAVAFQRAVDQMADLLEDLTVAEWSRLALRDLDVQGLIGHLIGAETTFGDGLEGITGVPEADDHVTSTQLVALAQAGRDPAETYQDWRAQIARTISVVAHQPKDVPADYYGIKMPLDQLLVVRSFEMWVHHEDIRRATNRPLMPPDPAALARMSELAVLLLPVGLVRTGRLHADRRVRLVLTGKGGGTWDVPLDGPEVVLLDDRRADTVVILDAAAFCRVAGNRDSLAGSGAVVQGDPDLAADLFVGAAALALD